MSGFIHESLPGRVVFGAGSLQHIDEEAERLDASRPLLISTPGRRALVEQVTTLLKGRNSAVFADARMHAPIGCVEAATAAARAHGADSLISCGGGSAIGIAKAVARQLRIPILAVATTYSGSEMTTVWSVTQEGAKSGGKDPVVRPRCVLYDPKLTVDLPLSVSVASGFNAMAHCVEALYGKDVSPIGAAAAERGIAAMASALPRLHADPKDIEARTSPLLGGYLGGEAMMAAGMAIHHKLCHLLGGTYGLQHAETHTVVLAHATRFNAPSTPKAMEAVARALGTNNAARGIYDLAARVGAPLSLAELGMPGDKLDEAARSAVDAPYYNPRPVDFAGLRELCNGLTRELGHDRTNLRLARVLQRHGA